MAELSGVCSSAISISNIQLFPTKAIKLLLGSDKQEHLIVYYYWPMCKSQKAHLQNNVADTKASVTVRGIMSETGEGIAPLLVQPHLEHFVNSWAVLGLCEALDAIQDQGSFCVSTAPSLPSSFCPHARRISSPSISRHTIHILGGKKG